MSILTSPAEAPRPAGVSLIAGLLALGAASGAALSFLMAANRVGITAGNFLVGPGLELAGPPLLLLFALVAATAAYGVFRLRNWGRLLTIALMVSGLVPLIPVISSAVTELRYSGLVRSGIGFQFRILLIWYLMKEDVRELYTSARRVRSAVTQTPA